MSNDSTLRRFIDEKELSIITGFALPTIRKWRHERRGPKYSKIFRMIRYDYNEVMKFMDDHRIEVER